MDIHISLSLSLRLPLCLSCSYYHARITRSRWRHRKAAAYAYVCVRVCVCVSFLIFLILLLLLFTIYLLKLLISLFAEERKPRGNLAYCYWCRCFLSPATVARSSLLLLHCLLATPHSPIPFTSLSLSLFLCFSLSLPLVSFSVFFVANSINVVVNRFCIERCLPFLSLLPSPSLVSLALQVLSVFSQSASCTLGTLCTCQCLCVCLCMYARVFINHTPRCTHIGFCGIIGLQLALHTDFPSFCTRRNDRDGPREREIEKERQGERERPRAVAPTKVYSAYQKTQHNMLNINRNYHFNFHIIFLFVAHTYLWLKFSNVVNLNDRRKSVNKADWFRIVYAA